MRVRRRNDTLFASQKTGRTIRSGPVYRLLHVFFRVQVQTNVYRCHVRDRSTRSFTQPLEIGRQLPSQVVRDLQPAVYHSSGRQGYSVRRGVDL